VGVTTRAHGHLRHLGLGLFLLASAHLSKISMSGIQQEAAFHVQGPFYRTFCVMRDLEQEPEFS